MTTAPPPLRFESRRTQTAWREAAVATSHYTAAATALRVLGEGGNAVDAAVAGTFTLTVCEPQSTSLGGDLCAMVHVPGAPVAALNATGPASRTMTLEALRAAGIADRWPDGGPATITVPGLARGAEALWRRFGHLPWPRLIDDAIGWAEHGIPVTGIVAGDWHRARGRLLRDPDSAAQLLRDGEPPAAGETWPMPRLARTLRAIRADGAAALYAGPIAAALAESVRAKGGFLTEDDLRSYAPRWVEPLRGGYRGCEILEMPPNSQGAIVLEALNMLAGLPAPRDRADRVHAQIEAVKLAFADARAVIADPDVAEVPVARLLSPEFAQERRALIDMGEARFPASAPPVNGNGTAYIAVVDPQGNAASVIHSTREGFGSGVTAGETGIVMQRRADGFSLDPRHPNAVAPGKRPFHTILPALAFRDGGLWAAFATTGGISQAQNQVQVLQRLIDDGAGPQEAVDAPRFSVREDFSVMVEERLDPSLVAELRARGQRIVVSDWYTAFGGGHFVVREDGWLKPASDPRRDGAAWGI